MQNQFVVGTQLFCIDSTLFVSAVCAGTSVLWSSKYTNGIILYNKSAFPLRHEIFCIWFTCNGAATVQICFSAECLQQASVVLLQYKTEEHDGHEPLELMMNFSEPSPQRLEFLKWEIYNFYYGWVVSTLNCVERVDHVLNGSLLEVRLGGLVLSEKARPNSQHKSRGIFFCINNKDPTFRDTLEVQKLDICLHVGPCWHMSGTWELGPQVKRL